jgi:hypothetical protein
MTFEHTNRLTRLAERRFLRFHDFDRDKNNGAEGSLSARREVLFEPAQPQHFSKDAEAWLGEKHSS